MAATLLAIPSRRIADSPGNITSACAGCNWAVREIWSLKLAAAIPSHGDWSMGISIFKRGQGFNLMAVQRNAIVAPFSNTSPLLERGEKGKPSNTLAFTHQKYFLQLQTGVNNSVQLSSTVPVNSSSPGEPGTIVLAPSGIYVCVGSNTWLKFIGAPF